jgi:hypothetical protein
VALAEYAERAYLEYALSVVKGRALNPAIVGLYPWQIATIFYSGKFATDRARAVAFLCCIVASLLGPGAAGASRSSASAMRASRASSGDCFGLDMWLFAVSFWGEGAHI